jgi:hypothetical protein
MAKNLIPQVKEAYAFGSTPSETVQSLEGLYARDYYNNHPCFAPWTHALIDQVGTVSVCCMMPNKPIIGNLRQQSIDFRFSIFDFRLTPRINAGA